MNEPIRTLVAPLLAAALLGLSACGDHGHSHDGPDAGASHGHAGATESVTHFTRDTELFVEFPRLVKGETAEFVAHLTRLADFRPVAEGRLTVILSGGGQPEEQGEAEVSGTPGIFRPIHAPVHAGKRRLVFRLESPGLNAIHELGDVEVYGDARAAAATPAAEERAGSIRFTKEDQWRIDFAMEPATEQPLRESIAATGVLRAPAGAEAFVVAPSAGALSAAARVPKIGDRVRRGDVLAHLVPRLAGDVDAAVLDLAARRARIELDHATRERERLEGLFRAEAVPEKRLIDAQSREQLVRAELAAAERRLAPYQGGGGGIPLRAPIDGVIVAANAAPGAAVAEGQTLFHIARLERLWLEARVPEAESARVGKPGGAQVDVDGLDAPLVLEVGRNASLVGAGGVVDPATRTVPVILELENPGGRLRIGAAVRVRLHTGQVSRAVAVPATALVDDQGQPVVYVQLGGESFARRPVDTGLRDGDRIAVTRGLAPGERVVTRGANQVRLAAAAPAAAGHGHAH